MSETMIERIATAIFDEWSKNISSLDFRQMAHAAIEAMRGPTEAMIRAGVHHDNMGDMAGRWNAMLDAALSPASNGAEK